MGELSYDDGRVRVDGDGVALRAYYFPWGTKHVALASVVGLERVDLSAGRGRARIWGTANPRYWANLDASRAKKRVGFLLDLGRSITPLVTPDDPDAFEAALRALAGLGPADGTSRPGPLI